MHVQTCAIVHLNSICDIYWIATVFEKMRERNSDFSFPNSASTKKKKKNRSLDGRDKSNSIVYFDQLNLMDSSVD